MLKNFKYLRELPHVYGTDRDAEMPVLLDFIKSKAGQFESLLDIGAGYSANTYAPHIRLMAKKYDGIDIDDDYEAGKIVDNFFLGNANIAPLKEYDMVICVSTIEHAGISTYKGNWLLEQIALFCRAILLAKKFVWISFPVGLPLHYPGEWSLVHDARLRLFESLVQPYKVKKRFFYTEWAQGGNPWFEHDDRNFAVSVPYHDEIGNQSICVLEIEK